MNDPAKALEKWLAPLQKRWCLVAIGDGVRGETLPLSGIWIADTDDVLRIAPPATHFRRDGCVDDQDIRLDAVEIGEALRRLLEGDSRILDAIFSHRNVTTSELHPHLLERARDGLHRGFVDDYVRRARDMSGKDHAGHRRLAAALLLRAEHLMRTGVVATDSAELAALTGTEDLLAAPTAERLEDRTATIRAAGAASPLPRKFPRPEALDELLLFVREAYWGRP
jgi:hypothetical protein